MLEIYTAGAVLGEIGDWRKDLPRIPNVRWLIPQVPDRGDRENHMLPDVFFPADIMALNAADAMLVNIIHGYKSLGTAHEVGYGYANGLMIFMVVPEGPEDDDMDDGTAFDNRFGMKMATALFPEMEYALEAIEHAARVVGDPIEAEVLK